MNLALLGDESLDDVLGYLVGNLEESHRQIFLTEKMIREYCMFLEGDTYFTYSFNFDNGKVFDCTFFKSDYYDYKNIKYRRKKLEKIIKRSRRNKFKRIIGL